MNLLDLMVKVSVDDKATEKIGPLSMEFKGKLATAAKVGAAAVAAVTAAVIGTTATLAASVKEVAAYGDNIDKMSQKLGVSSDAYQKWDYVMNIAGTSMDNMSMGMKTLTNKLDDAKNGSADAQEMFAKLGLSLEDLNSMSREEAFEATIKGFQGMADSTERAALANDLFGRSGQELTPLFNMTAEQTDELMQATERLGFVMSEEGVKAAAAYTDSHTTLMKTLGGVKNQLVGEFLPGITTVMDGLTELISGDAEKGAELVEQGVEEIIAKIEEVGPKVVEIVGRIAEVVAPPLVEAIGLLLAAMATEIIKHLPEMLQFGLELILQLISGFVNGIAPAMEQVNAFVQGILDAIGQFFINMFDAGVQLIQNIKDGAAQTASDMAAFFGGFIQAGIDAIVGFFSGMLNAGTQLWENLKSGATAIGSTIAGTFTSWIQSGLSGILRFVGSMLSAGVSLVSNLINGAASIGSSIASKFTGWISDAVSAIRGYVGTFFNAGASILNGFIDGIKSGFSRAVGAVEDGLSTIRSFLPFSPAKRGPFSGKGWTLYSGMSLMEGLADGIESMSGTAARTMHGAMEDVYGAMSGSATFDAQHVSSMSANAMNGGEVVAWLSENLGDIIATRTPVVSRRDFDRMARGAVA